MKNIPGSFVRLTLVVLSVGILNGPLPAQAPANPATRFRAVEGYSLFITVKADEDMKAAAQGNSLEEKFKEHFVARIDLTERHLDNDDVEWTGEGYAEQVLEEERKETHFSGSFEQDVKSVGQGRSKTKAKLYIDELKHTFRVIVDTEYVSGTLTGYRKDLGRPTEQLSGDTSLVTSGLRWLTEEYPLPGEGLGLMVDKAFPKEQCGVYLENLDWLNEHKDHAHLGRVQIDLTPLGVKEPKLILTPPDDYDTWRPRPPLASSPGLTPTLPVSVAGIDARILSPKLPLRIQYASFLPDDYQLQNDPQLGLNPGAALTGLSPFPLDIGWEIVPADTKVASVRFELTDVSQYPGWCMNWPAEPQGEEKFDLEFVDLPTYGDHTLERPLQILTLNRVSKQAALSLHAGPKGTVRLGSLDGAAIGVLTATAKLEDGRTLSAEISGNASAHRILIPDRDEGVSEISKHWRKEHAGDRKDEADDEEAPEGDGQVGDGLTVWEEYRGFYQGGLWRDDGNPRKKDLFIENTVGAATQGGIDLFRQITGLTVHDQILESERKSSRVINFNKRADRWVADQHCLVLRASDDPSKGTAEGEWYTAFTGHLGPPKHTEWVNVVIAQNSDARFFDPVTSTYVTRSWQNKHVAHELSHAIGVEHHGDADVFGGVTWSTWRGGPQPQVPMIAGQIFENAKQINVVHEATLRFVTIEQIFGSSAMNRTVRVGKWSGQHSGNWDCVMRYMVAEAYEDIKARATGRIWHGGGEPPGNILCDSPAGTGLNYPTHSPQPRYGGAAEGRGECIHQFVISDKYSGPQRRSRRGAR